LLRLSQRRGSRHAVRMPLGGLVPGFHVALATKPMAVSVMSRPPPVALAALMAPVATRTSVLATALMASFVDRLGTHCRAFSSARRPASVSRKLVSLSLSSRPARRSQLRVQNAQARSCRQGSSRAPAWWLPAYRAGRSLRSIPACFGDQAWAGACGGASAWGRAIAGRATVGSTMPPENRA
jgi:hypothetical protein